jgi:hypothetical protein
VTSIAARMPIILTNGVGEGTHYHQEDHIK